MADGMAYTVVFGTAWDGLTLYGPFATFEDAEIYAEQQREPYEIVEINPPENG